MRSGKLVIYDALSSRELKVVEEAVRRDPALGSVKAHAIFTYYEVSAPIPCTLNPASYAPTHPLSLETLASIPIDVGGSLRCQPTLNPQPST